MVCLSTFIESIVESFRDNLVVEDRYQMILDGLQVTLFITFFAVVIGTLFRRADDAAGYAAHPVIR